MTPLKGWIRHLHRYSRKTQAKAQMCVRVFVRAYVCACLYACRPLCECECVCVCVCVCVCACMYQWMFECMCLLCVTTRIHVIVFVLYNHQYTCNKSKTHLLYTRPHIWQKSKLSWHKHHLAMKDTNVESQRNDWGRLHSHAFKSTLVSATPDAEIAFLSPVKPPAVLGDPILLTCKTNVQILGLFFSSHRVITTVKLSSIFAVLKH